jgi:hypothetical protein
MHHLSPHPATTYLLRHVRRRLRRLGLCAPVDGGPRVAAGEGVHAPLAVRLPGGLVGHVLEGQVEVGLQSARVEAGVA